MIRLSAHHAIKMNRVLITSVLIGLLLRVMTVCAIVAMHASHNARCLSDAL